MLSTDWNSLKAACNIFCQFISEGEFSHGNVSRAICHSYNHPVKWEYTK